VRESTGWKESRGSERSERRGSGKEGMGRTVDEGVDKLEAEELPREMCDTLQLVIYKQLRTHQHEPTRIPIHSNTTHSNSRHGQKNRK
jgi:hypothetical protein